MPSTVAAVALGAVFLLSGVSKLAAPARWRSQAGELLAMPPFAEALPFVEVALGALLISGVQRRAIAATAGTLLLAFTMLLAVRIRQGRHPPCACFGSLNAKPIGWGHIARNALFIMLAVVAAL